MILIRKGDIIKHRKIDIIVRVLDVTIGEVLYEVITHTSKPKGYKAMADKGKVCKAISDGKYKVDETERMKLILKQYE